MTAIAPSLRTHGLAPARAHPSGDVPLGAARYARMFPELPSFEADEALLRSLGAAGGLCDCNDLGDPPQSLASVAAGWPFFGQLVAHDITADRSALQSHVNPGVLHNARSPRLDLECLFGDGPIGHPFLFRRDDPAKFLLGLGGADVQRNAEGVAIIGDPRNDSHMVISQMHLALLEAHNRFVDEARQQGLPDSAVFEAAARETRWHYQAVIVDEFLPSLVGQDLVDDITANGSRFFRPTDVAFIPLEFADAAYRYGHCQIRQGYRLNGHSEPLPIFPDLLGFRPVPSELTVDWSLLFDAPGADPAQRAKKIDGRLPRSLIHLPVAVTGAVDVEAYHSLAARDLERGQGVGLPSGEAVARRMGLVPLTPEQTGLRSIGWSTETPLWYYILREAAVTSDGDRLGPVGGRIVAEVIVTLLDLDPTSVRSGDPSWRSRRSLVELLQSGVRRA